MIKRKSYFILCIPVLLCNGVILRERTIVKGGVPGKVKSSAYSIIPYTVKGHLHCSAICTEREDCWAYNFYKNDGQSKCELLPFLATFYPATNFEANTEWNYFKRTEILAYMSSDGAVCMPYENMSNDALINSAVNFVCTKHAFIVDLWNGGKQDCKFRLLYNKNFPGYDVSGKSPLYISYHEMFQLCSECPAITCVGNSRCYLKYGSHLTEEQGYTNFDGVYYWYANCE